jgi:hypothetical protein
MIPAISLIEHLRKEAWKYAITEEADEAIQLRHFEQEFSALIIKACMDAAIEGSNIDSASLSFRLESEGMLSARRKIAERFEVIDKD